ncbi:hypothetical protein M422DRAFT_241965 [Sphaerobolus stellatus SS14]|nr:hypothetical protein M422DRAFT_241965 [Sphaerobolus stellatus SS14]
MLMVELHPGDASYDALPGFASPRLQTLLVYHDMAATCIVIWDWCLTFGDEVNLVWRATLVFAPDNHSPGSLQLSFAACRVYTWLQGILSYLVYHSLEVVMMLRIFAFYERRKRIMQWLSLIFFSKQAATIPIYIISLANLWIMKVSVPSDLPFGACLPQLDAPHVFLVYWVLNISVMAHLLFLLVFRFLKVRRDTEMAISPLLFVFVRDGAWAVGMTFLILIVCAFTFEFGDDKGNVAFAFLYATLSSCGSRLILNLREIAHAQVWSIANAEQLDFTCPELTVSGIGTELPTGRQETAASLY